MSSYRHDEWCTSRPAFGGGECDCYARPLLEKDKRIAELEDTLRGALAYLKDEDEAPDLAELFTEIEQALARKKGR